MPQPITIEVRIDPRNLTAADAARVSASINSITARTVARSAGAIGDGGARARVVSETQAASQVARIHAETARSSAASDRVIERRDAQLTAARTREARRAADNFIRTLDELRRAEARGAVAGGRRPAGRGDAIASGVAGGIGLPSGGAALAAVGVGLFVTASRAGVRAARELADANRVLAASAIEAGLSYSQASIGVARFAEQNALSRTEAARTFGEITRLSALAGRTGDLDLIQNRLSDLAAARGINPNQLSTIARQIISGEDEGINRLGLPNPSRIYEQFARERGLNPNQLTQQQQINSILEALLKRAELYEGAAAARLASLSGQSDLFEARIADATANFGVMLTSSQAFRDLLSASNEILSAMSVSASDVRAKLRAGQTPEQIAREQSGGALSYLTSFIAAQVSVVPSGIAAIRDLAAGEGLQTTVQRLRAAISPTGRMERNRRELVDLYRTEARVLADEELQAFTQAGQNLNQQLLESLQTARAAGFREQLRSAFDTANDQTIDPLRARAPQVGELQNQIERLRTLQRELGGLGNTLRPNEQAGFGQQIDAQIERAESQIVAQQRTALDRLRELRTETRSVFDDFAQTTGEQNPFVKFLIDSERAAESLQQRFGALGAETVAEFQRMQRAGEAFRLTALRIDSALRAFELRAEADRLRLPQVGLNAEQERQNQIAERQFNAAANIPQLLREARSFETGRTLRPEELRRAEQADYRSLLALRPQSSDDALTRAIAARVDQHVLDATANLPVNARASADPFIRSQAADRARALRGRAAGFEQEIGDEILRANASRLVVTQARNQLRELSRFGGIDDPQVRARFLSITGALDERELTPDLRQARIGALEREATAEVERERAAQAVRVAINAQLLAVSGQIGALQQAVIDRRQEAIVRITNQSEATVDGRLLGARPTRQGGE